VLLGRANRLQQLYWIQASVDDTATKVWVTSKVVCLMYISMLVGTWIKFNRSTVQMLMSVLDSDGAKDVDVVD